MAANSNSIRVPLEQLRDGARQLRDLSLDVSDYFDQLNNMADGLSGNGSWKGKDQKAFLRANASNQKKYKRTIQNLTDMASVLNNYCTVMEKVDKEQARLIRAIG